MSPPTLTGGRVLALGAVAAAFHAGFDLATYRSAWLRAPYLRLEDAPEAFQSLSPMSVSIAASAVSGVIAVLAVVAVEPAAGRRARALGAVLAGFWIFSAVLTQAVWLSTSWRLAATSLPLGLVRGLALGWLLARLCPAGAARSA